MTEVEFQVETLENSKQFSVTNAPDMETGLSAHEQHFRPDVIEILYASPGNGKWWFVHVTISGSLVMATGKLSPITRRSIRLFEGDLPEWVARTVSTHLPR